jgi:hypothetical protein
MCAYSLDHITQVTIDTGVKQLTPDHDQTPDLKPKRVQDLKSNQRRIKQCNSTFYSSASTSPLKPGTCALDPTGRQLPQSITEFFECICNNNAGQVYLRYIYHSLLNYNFTFHLVKEHWRKTRKLPPQPFELKRQISNLSPTLTAY